jgi:hypothetical protein
VRDLLDAVKLLDLVKGVYARREATVKAKDLLLDDCCERQIVKKLC